MTPTSPAAPRPRLLTTDSTYEETAPRSSASLTQGLIFGHLASSCVSSTTRHGVEPILDSLASTFRQQIESSAFTYSYIEARHQHETADRDDRRVRLRAKARRRLSVAAPRRRSRQQDGSADSAARQLHLKQLHLDNDIAAAVRALLCSLRSLPQTASSPTPPASHRAARGQLQRSLYVPRHRSRLRQRTLQAPAGYRRQPPALLAADRKLRADRATPPASATYRVP